MCGEGKQTRTQKKNEKKTTRVEVGGDTHAHTHVNLYSKSFAVDRGGEEVLSRSDAHVASGPA